jgi:hypothetical protein
MEFPFKERIGVVELFTNREKDLANTGYLDVTSGQRNIKVNVANTSTSVIDANVNLMQDKSYSIFASGAVANLAPLVLEDDLTAPTAGKIYTVFAKGFVSGTNNQALGAEIILNN